MTETAIETSAPLKQFEENPFTWGSGEHQVSSTVMELSLQQSNNDLMTFDNLTEDFVITIPGSSKHKMATQNVTFASTASKTAMYHSYNLTGMADGFLVTIIPLNLSVIYGVSGRYGGRPDDQNYNVSMETYVLPEQCALMKTLSGDEDDTDKTKATIFIKGERDPEKYYVKINILGPVTECDVEEGPDTRESDAGGFYSYQIQWARLSCRFWNETQEAWMTDGCAISNMSTINQTICHCNHLTSFGSDFATPPNMCAVDLDFGELKFIFTDVGDNGVVLATICVVFCFFVLAVVMGRLYEKSRVKSPDQTGVYEDGRVVQPTDDWRTESSYEPTEDSEDDLDKPISVEDLHGDDHSRAMEKKFYAMVKTNTEQLETVDDSPEQEKTGTGRPYAGRKKPFQGLLVAPVME
ncbi:polycystin-1-like protein 2 [Branchiostoma lanceolatum]|uniref:polycystin-1-like protein 2 n=1 Tax=Branchiostoma lanceolatum TaxID=7740 RepID=UPI0034514D55